eukprot:2566632-Rhodomonas_salina.2
MFRSLTRKSKQQKKEVLPKRNRICPRPDSNWRPFAYKANALTTLLRGRCTDRWWQAYYTTRSSPWLSFESCREWLIRVALKGEKQVLLMKI